MNIELYPQNYNFLFSWNNIDNNWSGALSPKVGANDFELVFRSGFIYDGNDNLLYGFDDTFRKYNISGSISDKSVSYFINNINIFHQTGNIGFCSGFEINSNPNDIFFSQIGGATIQAYSSGSPKITAIYNNIVNRTLDNSPINIKISGLNLNGPLSIEKSLIFSSWGSAYFNIDLIGNILYPNSYIDLNINSKSNFFLSPSSFSIPILFETNAGNIIYELNFNNTTNPPEQSIDLVGANVSDEIISFNNRSALVYSFPIKINNAKSSQIIYKIYDADVGAQTIINGITGTFTGLWDVFSFDTGTRAYDGSSGITGYFNINSGDIEQNFTFLIYKYLDYNNAYGFTGRASYSFHVGNDVISGSLIATKNIFRKYIGYYE